MNRCIQYHYYWIVNVVVVVLLFHQVVNASCNSRTTIYHHQQQHHTFIVRNDSSNDCYPPTIIESTNDRYFGIIKDRISCSTIATTPYNREHDIVSYIPRGGDTSWYNIIPAGWNPMGYKITKLGEQFLSIGDTSCLQCDVGRFIASLKSSRKTRATIKDAWLEIVRASHTGQSMRIYRTIDELIEFCIKAGFID